MTDKQLLSVYTGMCGKIALDYLGPTELPELVGELRRMEEAKNAEQAGKVIEWWATFGEEKGWNRTATTFAREFRRRLAAKRRKK